VTSASIAALLRTGDVDLRPRDERQRGNLGRPVAVVRDADELVEQPELGDDVGGRGQQRDDSHPGDSSAGLGG
jgi:hypothetical protein